MDSLIFVLCIVAIACTTGVLTEYFKSRGKREKKAVGDDALVGDTLAQIDALEERIRVLERIVTESKFDLRREIDRL